MGGFSDDISKRQMRGKEYVPPSTEVLIGDEWFSAEHPPSDFLEGGVVHNGVVYVHSGSRIFCCDYQLLIASCRHPDADKPLKWSEIRDQDPIVNLLSFGQRLVMICKWTMHACDLAYLPLTDESPWVPLGRIPIGQQDCVEQGNVTSSAVLPTGGLVAIQEEFLLGKISHPLIHVMELSLMGKYYNRCCAAYIKISFILSVPV